MCKWGNTINVKVKIPSDLDRTGTEQWRVKPIDSCIATIVKALQDAGIGMRGSCCGHDKCEGEIHLQDGRVLLALNKEQSRMYWKFLKFKDGEPVRSIVSLMEKAL